MKKTLKDFLIDIHIPRSTFMSRTPIPRTVLVRAQSCERAIDILRSKHPGCSFEDKTVE